MKRNIRNSNYLLIKTIYMSNLEKSISILLNNRVDANYILLIELITCICLLNFLNYYIAELLLPFVIKKKKNPSPRFATKRFFLNNGEREKTYLKRY